MNEKITLCLDRGFAEDLNIALHEVLSFYEDSLIFDPSILEPLDDLHLVFNIRLNNQVV